MYFPIILSILLIKTIEISSAYLEKESNFRRPERNNKVNKGVWIKNKYKEDLFEKTNTGDFIFRENSLDVDNLLQSNFDPFSQNYQDSPIVSSYFERKKRSNHKHQHTSTKSINDCNDEDSNTQKFIDENPTFKSKLMSKLKPTSVFNDYPYEVAILLNNDQKDLYLLKNVKDNVENNTKNSNEEKNTNSTENIDRNSKTLKDNNKNKAVIPKRSKKYNYEPDDLKKIEFTEDVNRTDEVPNKKNVVYDVFNENEKAWSQHAPVSNGNVYKVLPKVDNPKIKPITERGLIKVLSMLTKTFKRVMKQHEDIKKIHNKLKNIDEEFESKLRHILPKFEDFDVKYEYILALVKKLKVLEDRLNAKDEYFINKESEMAKNLQEFENQQKKFLNQQRQFYAIQKLMLSQNEKINIKQNLIAKTQSEISHRQNNFARILKKAKQIYMESKNPFKLNINKPVHHKVNNTESHVTHTTTIQPQSTDSVKINLFSIPVPSRLENKDKQILTEKDEQPVDELVYKYYFNNTFIDNLVRSKILANMPTVGNTEIVRNAKTKRNEDKIENTILIPVNKSDIEIKGEKTVIRERRWINHHSKRKSKRKNRGKTNAVVENDDAKNAGNKIKHTKTKDDVKPIDTISLNNNDPFLWMARNFCNQIGQNTNAQQLGWCVEKALRRLQFLDMKIPMPTSGKGPTVTTRKTTSTSFTTTETSSKVADPVVSTTSPVAITSTTPPNTVTETPIYFPDNDELESNLKQYELKPDMEGTVYFDGSLHASDILPSGVADSNGISDIMPGLDSNSRVELDPLTFDLHTRRRASVRRINAKIMKKFAG